VFSANREIGERTQKVWDRFYNWSAIWQRSACIPTLRARIAFMCLSKLYRQMYAGTGISTDSGGRNRRRGRDGRHGSAGSCLQRDRWRIWFRRCGSCSLRLRGI